MSLPITDAKCDGASRCVLPSNNTVFFVTRRVGQGNALNPSLTLFEVAHLSAEGTAFDSLGSKSQGMMPIMFPSSQPRSTAYAIDRGWEEMVCWVMKTWDWHPRLSTAVALRL